MFFFVCSENFDVVVGIPLLDVWHRVDISFDKLGIVEQRRRGKKGNLLKHFERVEIHMNYHAIIYEDGDDDGAPDIHAITNTLSSLVPALLSARRASRSCE